MSTGNSHDEAPPSAGARSRRPWMRAVVLVAALGAIGVAAYSVKDQIPWTALAPKAAGSAPAAEPDLPAMRARLTISRADAGNPASPLMAMLDRTEPPSQQALIQSADPRRLLNEIVRQAVLGAAHNHLGAITRDAAIGDSAPGGAGPVAVEASWLLTPLPRGSTLALRPAGDPAAKPLVWKLPTAGTAVTPVATTYPAVLERAEAIAREELPKAFESFGLKGQPLTYHHEGALPKGVEERLATPTFTEQFAALRAIEAAIRAEGESPWRLGGLVRGYANLGVLTEFHWNPAHDVFKARALLAAQRWVARAPQSSDALHHRAYAYALAGLHRFALDDLAAAFTRPGAEPPPGWVALLDAYCRFHTQTLLDAPPGPDRPLALLLAFLTVEGGWSTARQVDVGREALRELPECYRVHDGVCAKGGVAVLHRATAVPLAVYAREVPRRLQAMPDLPPGLSAQLDEPGSEPAAAKALAAFGQSADRGEPSWSVLGRLMDETRFVQVWRRAEFFAFTLGVPAGDFVRSALPLVADHPYHALVEACGVDFARDYPRYQALVRSVKVPDVDAEITELRVFFDTFSSFDPGLGQAFFRDASLREDSTERDLKLFLPRVAESEQARSAKFLLDVSPHSPVARAYLIERSWAEVEPKEREWEAEGDPQILLALGRRYTALKRWIDAERCLRASLKLAPDKSGYENLAQVYRMQGDMKGWQRTLDEFLGRTEDYGLDHAQVQAEVANRLMEDGRFQDAKPYAAAAAESWAAFGIDCARRCYEELKEWDKGELWARRATQRYPDQYWAYWYLFCLRTGHGDVDAAREITARYIASVDQRAAGVQRISFGMFYLLGGQRREALAFFRNGTGDALVPGLLFAFLTADALGDAKVRDACLERLTTDPECTAQSKSLPIYKMYRTALASDDPGALDLEAIDREIDAMPEENRGNAEFHVGWFLSLHGTPDQAKPYLERCIKSKSTFFWYQHAAKAALKDPPSVLGKAR